jgi:xylulose-5-phosphate/fructose-6-phosphate phosphoketolase
VVMASCGDVPTTGMSRSYRDFANSCRMRKSVRERSRPVRLVSHTEHPHGMTDRGIHRLRPGQHSIYVRGYKEQGNINTPLELAIRSHRRYRPDAPFHVTGAGVREALINQQIGCKGHAYEFGIDPPEITDWKWHLTSVLLCSDAHALAVPETEIRTDGESESAAEN